MKHRRGRLRTSTPRRSTEAEEPKDDASKMSPLHSTLAKYIQQKTSIALNNLHGTRGCVQRWRWTRMSLSSLSVVAAVILIFVFLVLFSMITNTEMTPQQDMDWIPLNGSHPQTRADLHACFGSFYNESCTHPSRVWRRPSSSRKDCLLGTSKGFRKTLKRRKLSRVSWCNVTRTSLVF